MDILIMHLCEETAPENQKFILQEVGELSFLPADGPWAIRESVRVRHSVWHSPGEDQGCGHAWTGALLWKTWNLSPSEPGAW